MSTTFNHFHQHIGTSYMIRKEKIENSNDLFSDMNEVTHQFARNIAQLPLPELAVQITDFNKMYGMPTNTSPTTTPGFDVLERMKNFKKILQKEVNEIDEIIEEIQVNQSAISLRPPSEPTPWLTMLSDLLGDIIVYARSEGEKYGIPMDNVLNIIMESNFSKMGEDGKPIFDADGKLEKGPNYWKPEPRIEVMLTANARIYAEFDSVESSEDKISAVMKAIKSGDLELSTYGVLKSDEDAREQVANELKQIVGMTRMVTSALRMKLDGSTEQGLDTNEKPTVNLEDKP